MQKFMQSGAEATFSAAYCRRTSQSRKNRQKFGTFLADSRITSSSRSAFRDFAYPIVGSSAEGARLWDIDGNEYIDFTMGFGVLFFGHSPQFISQTLMEGARDGFALGPQAADAGTVAEHITKMTNMHRAFFCNTGTEAVMASIRLSRAVTGKQKIVLFWGAYHGWYDATLGRPRGAMGDLKTPVGARGVSIGALQDSIILKYGDPDSLKIIKDNAEKIAAVLAEPVQSRNLALQPRTFLAELKELTRTFGIALIFDDILLGFRVHPRGSQGWFNIDADLVTYGKLIGGGLPIGVVAGTKQYMDAVDGGFWTQEEGGAQAGITTFLPGTFNKHPLTMRLVLRVLDELEAGGPGLQQELSAKCTEFVRRIQLFFDRESVPIGVESFASIFRFLPRGKRDNFYYYLVKHGIYIWEGRTCFLSLAHDNVILDEAFDRIVASVGSMRRDGIF